MGCVQSSAASPSETVEKVPAASKGCTSGNQEPQPAFRETYSLGQTLGEGAFGQVRRGQHLATRAPVAVKVLEAERRTSNGRLSTPLTPFGDPNSARKHLGVEGRAVQQGSNSSKLSVFGSSFSHRQHKDPLAKFHRAAQQELAMLRAIGNHQHCIQFVDSFQEPDRAAYYIVLELCNSTLLEYLDQTALDSLVELQRIFKEMALGVAYVHGLRLMHRDIKPANFLVGGEDGTVIKLADFGAADKIPRDGSLRHSIFGTAPYMSPEMLGDEGYDESTDIWSLGTTYYEILFGERPYCPNGREPAKLKAAIIFGDPEPTFQQPEGRGFPGGVPKQAEELVKRCLDRDPLGRPSAAGVTRDIFLRDAKVHDAMVSSAESDASTAVPNAGSP